MTVRRLRSLKEAEDSNWRDPHAPGFWAAVSALWRFSRHFAPQRFPPGVHKFRSVEEMNRSTSDDKPKPSSPFERDDGAPRL
jgi:hypothetical protein